MHAPVLLWCRDKVIGPILGAAWLAKPAAQKDAVQVHRDIGPVPDDLIGVMVCAFFYMGPGHVLLVRLGKSLVSTFGI